MLGNGVPGRESTSGFGRRLAMLRVARGLSQMELALTAGVSTRHLSFLETARARPSRDMVFRLAEAMALSSLDRDKLLLCAGLAPHAVELADGLGEPSDLGLISGLIRSTSSNILDTAIDIQSTSRSEDAVRVASRALKTFGFRYFFSGVLSPAVDQGPPVIAFGDLRHAPTDWLDHYRRRGFRGSDPFVRATAIERSLFFWEDILARRAKPSATERRIMDEASEFQITSGFVMPVRLPDGRVHALSAMGDRVEHRDPRARVAVRLIATALLERLEAHDLPDGTLSH